ncbi:MAG: hypothetical protein PF904_17255 [Kiritimatiellae bacterium]|jgi:hypothetical protein|nr:hypothetical protein [Kiritimatiellia bacterium]
MNNDPVNVICFKWGTRYGAHYVNNLYSGVKKHLHRPFRFLCVTEDASELNEGIEIVPFPPNPGHPNWPSVFLKLLITADGFADLKGPTLFCDIDIIITGDIDCLFEYKLGKNVIIHNWIERRKTILRKRPDVGNSSLFRFEAGKSQYICDTFMKEKELVLDRSIYVTEQAFLTYAMKEVSWWPEKWVRSFKRHSMRPFPLNLVQSPILPKGTRVLVFHGRPDPDQALYGFKGKHANRHCLPASWIRDYWISEDSMS